MTFETPREMEEQILAYLRAGRQHVPADLLAKKMTEISASHFASEVCKFYQYAIDNYQLSEAAHDQN